MSFYYVGFSSPIEADKLKKLLNTAKIKFHSVEALEDSFIAAQSAAFDSMRSMLMEAHDPVYKLRADLIRAEKAFNQAPTPALSSAIKRIKSKLRYQLRKKTGV